MLKSFEIGDFFRENMNKIGPFVRENFLKTDPIQRQIPVWLIMGVNPPGYTLIMAG